MDSTVAFALIALALLIGAAGCASDPPGESPSPDALPSRPSEPSAPPDLSAGLPTVRIGHIDFVTDYDAALSHARKTDQLLWLHFGENPG